jgi:hypothetical protein
VVFGRVTSQTGAFPAFFALSDLLAIAGGDGSEGFVVNGIDSDDRLGGSVSGAGDINGDGVDDIVIGAFDVNIRGHHGESYVTFGRPSVAANRR